MVTATRVAGLIAGIALAGTALGGVRDVQIQQVDFSTGIVTLVNFGTTTVSLNGFQLCTADENEILVYTFSGFAGKSIAPGAEFRIHINNDAPVSDSAAINVSAVGPIATPFDRGPYGFALYWQTPFSLGANMADYLLWTDSMSNPGNSSADIRAPTAVSGGLWVSASDFIVTDTNTTRICLDDATGALLHDSADYSFNCGASACPADTNDDGDVDVIDLLALLGAWGFCPSPCPPDIDNSGIVDVTDLLALLGAWGRCP